MADLKVTKMVMKVDLQCSKCYKKIKKVLCRYPQIRDQVYDEKNNTVTITVVCCSPECIMEKIICRAGDTVESIEIVPDKPKEPEKPKPKPAEKPKEPEKPKPVEKPKEPEKPKDPPKPEKPKVVIVEPPKEVAKPPAPAPAPKAPAPAPAPKAPAPTPAPKAPAPTPAPKAPAPTPAPKAPAPAPPKAPEPVVQGFPQPPPAGAVPMYPIGVCCCCCYEGGPCYQGRSPMCYDGCGRPAYDCEGGNRGYYVSRCDEYLSEDNASGCRVM